MKNKWIHITTVITVLFCIAIAFDISPYLRGPAPYPPDWRWDYLFVNTLEKLWAPLVIISVMLYGAHRTEKFSEKQIAQYEKPLVGILILLFFLFQLSTLYFSRAGVGVLLHRIINPDLNGYFTAATQIKDFYTFIHTYNETVLLLPQHAQGHPPGAILFFYFIEQVFKPFSSHFTFLHMIRVDHSDVFSVWSMLSLPQKATALFTGVFIPFLSSLTLIPLYFIAKKIYSLRVAVRTIFFYLTIPSIILFIPINDVFLPLIILLSFLSFCSGINHTNRVLLILSGLLFSVGLFFSISLAPLFVIFGIYLMLQKLELKTILMYGAWFSAGICLLPLFLYLFFGYNTIEVSKTLLSGLPEQRLYTTWVFYNLYDFFIFAGIPITVLFILLFSFILKHVLKKQVIYANAVGIGFISMILLLDISGSVRGEVARIWLPFYPFLALIITNFMTKQLKVSSNSFLLFLGLQCLQVLVMQEFWVVLW